MTATAGSLASNPSHESSPATTPSADYPADSLRFDWLATLLSVWFVGGLYLDGWAHFHGRVDSSFFTPWHAVLYSGFAAAGALLVSTQWRNVGRGYRWSRALPPGYRLSLIGVALFAIGGVGDLVWHTLFGIEQGLAETLLSPTHLLLAAGMTLIITGPLRSALSRRDRLDLRGWYALGPAIVTVTLLLAVFGFFTSFAHPLLNVYAGTTGTERAYQYHSDLYVINVDGTRQTRLTANRGFYGWYGAWSPDGSRIAFTVGNSQEANDDLYLIDADGSNQTRLTDLP